MSPIDEKHDALTRYLAILFSTYFALKPTGLIRQAPFLMHHAATNYDAEPDLQIILKTNPHELKPTMMDGPADICIEIISPESGAMDRGKKFDDYEAAGVREYWLFDPTRAQHLFYRLNAEGHYVLQLPDEDGYYRTPLLPGFALHVPTLSQEPLPDPIKIVQAVKTMLGED